MMIAEKKNKRGRVGKRLHEQTMILFIEREEDSFSLSLYSLLWQRINLWWDLLFMEVNVHRQEDDCKSDSHVNWCYISYSFFFHFVSRDVCPTKCQVNKVFLPDFFLPLILCLKVHRWLDRQRLVLCSLQLNLSSQALNEISSLGGGSCSLRRQVPSGEEREGEVSPTKKWQTIDNKKKGLKKRSHRYWFALLPFLLHVFLTIFNTVNVWHCIRQKVLSFTPSSSSCPYDKSGGCPFPSLSPVSDQTCMRWLERLDVLSLSEGLWVKVYF